MEFNYEVLSYIPYENRMFVSYKPVDTTLTPHGAWAPVGPDMTEEQIKESIIKAAPLYVWEAPVNEIAKNLTGFQTSEPVSRTSKVPIPMSSADSQRRQRDMMLFDSDWTVMPDSPLSETKIVEWKVYRQALRDIPLQPGFPDNIQWPVEPV